MAIISNSTLKNIAAELETKNALLAAIAGENPGTHVVENWSDIPQIVGMGVADKVFAIGEQLICNYNYGGTLYECPWDIVDFGHAIVKDENGVEVDKPAMFLQMHYSTIEGVQFDAPEPNNTLNPDGTVNTDVAAYGYNRWSESGLRAWLNSSADASRWFGNTFEVNGETKNRRTADVAPAQHTSYNGFMAGLDEDFLSIVKPIKVTTATNTITDGGVIDYTWDRFFPASLVQNHINPQSAVEGTEWAYYKAVQETAFAQYGTYTDLIKYALNNHNSAQACWLRSASRGTSRLAWNINSSGYVYYYANNAFRCAPACAIVGI